MSRQLASSRCRLYLGLGIRVWGLGFGAVWGLGFFPSHLATVWGLGLCISSVVHTALGFGFGATCSTWGLMGLGFLGWPWVCSRAHSGFCFYSV